MLPRGRGSIFFTGATASMRGGNGYAAFASAKFGLRAVAQSMARELGPQGIHVAHLVIDAGVDTAWVRERIKAREGEAALANSTGPLMDPASIAEAYWQTASTAARCLDARTRHPAVRRNMVRRMTKVEFHFDFGSPNAYLAHRVIPEIEQRTGATFDYVPVLLGGVFKATNNRSPAESVRRHPEQAGIRAAGNGALLCAPRDHGVQPEPVLSGQHVDGSCAARWRRRGRRVRALRRRGVPAHVGAAEEDGRAGGDPCRVGRVGPRRRGDSGELLQDAEVKAQLIENTEASVARGTFGSPTFFVGDEIWFGKDRLRDVEDAIAAAGNSA